jgi:quinolinate synthase
VGSTAALLKRVRSSPATEFIVATEPGIFHEMQKAAPDKRLFEAPIHGTCATSGACNTCPHMRRNTLEKLRDCLRDLTPVIDLPVPVREAALRPMQRMLDLSRQA